jgi:uncharacterized repeat protein (TIGR01451 family)
MNMFRLAWPVISAVTLSISMVSGVGAATPGGTVISNAVAATYSDGNGNPFTTVSNTVAETVANVSAVGVTPNENGCNPQTDAYAVGSNVSKTFTVTNNSNFSDAYTLSAATTGGTVASVVLTVNGQPVSNFTSGSVSPQLTPGSSLQAVVTIATTGVSVGTNIEISLTATSTAVGSVNGQASATASQCAVTLGKANIAGPTGATSQVQKLIDGLSFEAVKPGQSVTYSIKYENYGGTAAANTVLTDVFPAGVTPSLASLAINGTPVTSGATVNGQTVTIALGALAPTTLYTLTITAAVSASATTGAELINTATITSSNGGNATSSPAAALIGSADVVYDGYVGASLPIVGATVSLVNPKTGQPVTLSGAPLTPNTTNTDPFVTGAAGTYAFGLGAGQIGPVSYDLVVTAAGYISRNILVTLTPDPTGTYYSVTLTAQDGEPLAVPGGFTLEAGPVTIAQISDLFGNIPMFRAKTINITKTVDRSVASGGDRLVYTIEFSNIATPLGAATLLDTLPVGVFYAPGTGLVDGKHVEPVVAGRTLTWTFPTLTTSHKVVYATVIEPGISAGQTLTNLATVTSSPQNEPTLKLSASASVDTVTIAGLFSDSTIITGRVFVDLAGDGWFHKGDKGIPGVRIFLEDGESVVTDPNGRYSFPGVRPGMHVLKLDRSTLPAGTKPYDIHDYDDQKSTRRLVHGVFDGGIIEDINFAIEAVQ